jgi:flagellin-like hook-associated protein FlgL
MNTDFNIGAMGDVALSRATASKRDSIASLASGKKSNLAHNDSGSFSLSQRLQVQSVSNRGASVALQNAMSVAQAQQGALEKMTRMLERMNEVAGMASNLGTLSSEREFYQTEFEGLLQDFDKIQNDSINGVNLFGNYFSQEKKDFIDSLKNSWLKAAEDLIESEFARPISPSLSWTPDPTDSIEIIVDEYGAQGGYAAYASATQPASGPGDNLKMVFDLPDFSAPHTQPTSIADTTVAHEMTHVLMAQNTHWGDLVGDGTSSANWFREGLAEAVPGAHKRVINDLWSILQEKGIATDRKPTAAELKSVAGELINYIGTGNEDWVESQQYSAAYLAVAYADYTIRLADTGEGVRSITEHLTDNFLVGQTPADSGLDSYWASRSWSLRSELNNMTRPTSNADFIDKFKNDVNFSGVDYLHHIIDRNVLGNDELGDDYTGNGGTGSLRGGGDSRAMHYNPSSFSTPFSLYSETDVIADTTGSPRGTYVFEDETPSTVVELGDFSLTINPINPLTFGDSNVYNLNSEASSNLVMDRVDNLLEIIGTFLGQVGANMGSIERKARMVDETASAMASAISRVSDVSLPEEALSLARAELLINSNINMRVQARNIQQDVMLTMLG